jgi:hypothetical protein
MFLSCVSLNFQFCVTYNFLSYISLNFLFCVTYNFLSYVSSYFLFCVLFNFLFCVSLNFLFRVSLNLSFLTQPFYFPFHSTFSLNTLFSFFCLFFPRCLEPCLLCFPSKCLLDLSCVSFFSIYVIVHFRDILKIVFSRLFPILA